MTPPLPGLGRRLLLASLTTSPLAPRGVRAATLPVPAGDRLGFDVMRRGARLGEHVLTFHRTGETLDVTIRVAVAYSIGPITLYRYRHEAQLRWQGARVVAIDSRTDDNGTHDWMNARPGGGAGLVVQGATVPRYTAPPDAEPSTHWNRVELSAPWINTQTGRLMRPTVTPTGRQSIPTVSGTIAAEGYLLTGDVDLRLWYDAAGWAGLEFSKNGTPVSYLRQA